MRNPRRLLAAAALAVAALGAHAAPVPVAVAVDSSADSTRVVLTAAKPLVCDPKPVGQALEVTCSEPLAVTPAERKVGDGILTGWSVRGDRMIVLALAPGYRSFASFELKNPTRLVLDLSGTRGKAAASSSTSAPPTSRPIIVVDAGHGGVETGASGPTGLVEKDVTLDLARRLAAALEKDGVTAVLTRDDDRVVSLQERTAIANHNRAELFVSIHLNASRRPSAYGAETYFSSPESTDDEANTLAALENKAYAPEGAPSPSPGAGSDRDLEMILWDMAQNEYLAESGRLAEAVQRELNALTGVRDRGVRQAPFTVLMGATMPAILVEVAFVSNPQEEAKLKDAAYKDKIVQAIATAIREFRGRRGAPGGARP